jgi:catalase
VADDVDEKALLNMQHALEAAGAVAELIAPKLGSIQSANNTEFPIMKSFLTTASVLYDAVYVPGGTNSVATLAAEPDAIHFLNEAFKHCKAIAADKDALQVLEETAFYNSLNEEDPEDNGMNTGIVIGADGAADSNIFIKAIAQHRFWDRENQVKVPA